MVHAEKRSKLGHKNKVTSLSSIEKLKHSKPIGCAASNKLDNISNEKEIIQNRTETQAMDKPVTIASEENVAMELSFEVSDVNEWRTVSNSRKKNRMHNINANGQNPNLKIPRKESKYKSVNFSSNQREERFNTKEYKKFVVKDKFPQKTLHDSSVGKVPRFTKLGSERKTEKTDVAYENSTEFLSSKNKNHHNLNQELLENPCVEKCVTANVQRTKEFDFTSEKEIEQSKLSELKKAPMKQSYAQKCILSLTDHKFKNKGAFYKHSQPGQNQNQLIRNSVGPHESKTYGLNMAKSKKQEKTKDIISESCVMSKKMVNKSSGIDCTINDEQLNKHTNEIDLLKPVHKVNDVINIKEQNQNVAASLKNREILSNRKTVRAHESEPNQLDPTKSTSKSKKQDKIDTSMVSKSESYVMNKKTVNISSGIDCTINEQLIKHTKVIDLLKPVHKVNDVINIKEQNQNVAASLKNREILSSRKTVEALESEPNQLVPTKSTSKSKKQDKIDKSMVSKSESNVMNKKTVNKLGRDDTIDENKLNAHVEANGVINSVDVKNLKERYQKVAGSFMNAENLSSIKTDAQDEYKLYESNQPLTKYLEVGQNAENIRYDWDNNAEASNTPVQRCDWDNNAEASNTPVQRCDWGNNAEASNIPVQRCDWDNAEASNIPVQRYEWDNNVEASSIQSPRCDWENNAESGIIPSQRCDWDNTEESSVPSQQCYWDNGEASNIQSQRCDCDNEEVRNIQSQRCDWDNNAEASTIPSQQYYLDNNAEASTIPSQYYLDNNAEASAIPFQQCDWDNNAEASAIPFQPCDWDNNAEASNIPFQQYNHINSENVDFLQSESVSIMPLFAENTGSGFRPQLKGFLISVIPNHSFDNAMPSNSIYSNQFQSFMNYDQYYQEHATNEQGSGNSITRQNNPNAIYNSVISGMPSRKFALSWTDGKVVYFDYYQSVAPVPYPCFVSVVGPKLVRYSPQFVPDFDVNSSYTAEDVAKES